MRVTITFEDEKHNDSTLEELVIRVEMPHAPRIGERVALPRLYESESGDIATIFAVTDVEYEIDADEFHGVRITCEVRWLSDIKIH